MSENPSPSPEHRPDAQSSPEAAGGGRGGLRGEAYIPRPQESRSRRGFWLAAALLLTGVGGYAVHHRHSASEPIPAAASVRERVLRVSLKDRDLAATERVRRALDKDADAVTSLPSARGGAPAATASAPAATASQPSAAPSMPALAAPAALAATTPKVQESPRPIPLPGLTPEGRHAVRAGGFDVFSMEMVDNVFEDGDVVLVSVDGVPMCYVTIAYSSSKIEIPLKPGERHKITITGIEDGGDVVTLGVRTSLGEMTSNPLMKGQSEDWTISFE